MLYMILLTELQRAGLGRNLYVNNGNDAQEACTPECNLGSYQLSTFSKSGEHSGTHRLIFPITGHSGHTLPAIRHCSKRTLTTGCTCICFVSELQMCLHSSFLRLYSYGRVPYNFIRRTVKSFLLASTNFYLGSSVTRGARWRSWSRNCATSQKVAGSIPDTVTGIFH